MNPETPQNATKETDSKDREGRRDAVKKLGKFAAYAAPFTALALTKKADAASGFGPHKH